MTVGLRLAGRYELTMRLGAGGMGSVWRAKDLNLESAVAIKLIEPSMVASPEALARFRREALAAASIRSPHVVQIFDYGIDQGTPYIAMELLCGESLARRLERSRTVDPETTTKILDQVARALSLAHSSGIIHRDLKPDNIFLVRDEDEYVAKVLDFGVARRVPNLTARDAVKTRTGALIGTPSYMSPEQANGEDVDFRTDIWAYGVIACECLTGRRPFEASTIAGLFHAICFAPLPLPSRLGVVPPGFDEWFLRCVTRNRGECFGSVREAADALARACGVKERQVAVTVRSSIGTEFPVATANSELGSAAGGCGAVTLGSTTAPSALVASQAFTQRRGAFASAIAIVSVFAILATVFWARRFSRTSEMNPMIGSALIPLPAVSPSPEPPAPAPELAGNVAPAPISPAPVLAASASRRSGVAPPKRAISTVAKPSYREQSRGLGESSAQELIEQESAPTNPFTTRK